MVITVPLVSGRRLTNHQSPKRRYNSAAGSPSCAWAAPDLRLGFLYVTGSEPRPRAEETGMPAARFVAPASPSIVAPVRHRVMATLRAWGIRLDEETAGDIAVVVSELVTNSVVHAGGDLVNIAVYAGRDRLLIEVYDASPQAPASGIADEEDTSGRGLFLVEALAVCHGSSPTPQGKKTWAELDISRRPAPSGAPPESALTAEHRRAGLARTT
ncbi:ATP-binding protein [Kitasatospora sp. NPDC017646]|uniref:ATP-binding protein n=1 Tax=Kitasatospora sp. NPDC017646 TaxID=3364024 RepID=UPI0037B2AC23